MKVTIENVTPATAEQWLARNTRNRPIRLSHVNFLSAEMTAGRWKVNGDTICFSKDALIDGQHRLHAVIASGKSITTVVVRGTEQGAFDTKDVGSKRSAGDVLSVLGYDYATAIAAALPLVDQYMTGQPIAGVRYANSQIKDLMAKYPDIRDSVARCASSRRLISGSILSSCHYLFAMKDREAADRFVDELIKGVGLEAGDPVYSLRERLMQNMMGKAKMQRRYIMAITIKAWNARRRGATITRLSWSESRNRAEPFPLVK